MHFVCKYQCQLESSQSLLQQDAILNFEVLKSYFMRKLLQVAHYLSDSQVRCTTGEQLQLQDFQYGDFDLKL